MLFCCRMKLLEMLDPLKIQFPHQLSQYFKGELHPALSVFLMRWTTPHQYFRNIYRYSKAKTGIESLPVLFIWCLWRPVGMLTVICMKFLPRLLLSKSSHSFAIKGVSLASLGNLFSLRRWIRHHKQYVCKNKLKESKSCSPWFCHCK